MDSSWKNSWHTLFSCPSYLPFWSYAPLKKSEWNLMHAISYEPCMQGFGNFLIWIPHGKIADAYFFSFPSYLPFWSYAPLKKSEWNLASNISQKVFELGVETWSADRGWWVDYLIKFKKKDNFIFPELWPFANLGIFNLSARLARKVFELGAWNLVSW